MEAEDCRRDPLRRLPARTARLDPAETPGLNAAAEADPRNMGPRPLAGSVEQ